MGSMLVRVIAGLCMAGLFLLSDAEIKGQVSFTVVIDLPGSTVNLVIDGSEFELFQW